MEGEPIVLHNNFDDAPISVREGSALQKFLRIAAPDLSLMLDKLNQRSSSEYAKRKGEKKNDAVQISCNLNIETWHRPTEQFFERLFIAAPQLKSHFTSTNGNEAAMSNNKPVRLVLSIQMMLETPAHGCSTKLEANRLSSEKSFPLDYSHYEAFFHLFLECMKNQRKISDQEKDAWRKLSDMFLQEARNYLLDSRTKIPNAVESV